MATPYAIPATVRALLGDAEFAALAGDASFDPTCKARLLACCEAANSLVDQYVLVRHAQSGPLGSMPILVDMATRLAIHDLFVGLHDVPEIWRDERARIIKQLERIASGSLLLLPPEPGASPPGGGVARTTPGPRRLGELDQF